MWSYFITLVSLVTLVMVKRIQLSTKK